VYKRKLAWIDKESFLPLKEEYYDAKDDLIRVFSADEFKPVQGHWTITRRTMKNTKTGHSTETVFTTIAYDVGLSEDLFSERYLRQPPMKEIQ
jgi:outer membrane lipoprotein-sorting protein